MHFFSPSLALTGTDLGLIFGLVGLGIGLFFGFFGMYFHHRQRVMWHETTRIALEKGQPVPVQMKDETHWGPKHEDERNDFRGGLVLIATGAGLYLFLGALVGHQLQYVGAIPGFIGVALLIHGLLHLLFPRKPTPSVDRPPQS